MIKLNVTSVMVLDQDEALDFYVTSSGWRWPRTSSRVPSAG